MCKGSDILVDIVIFSKKNKFKSGCMTDHPNKPKSLGLKSAAKIYGIFGCTLNKNMNYQGSCSGLANMQILIQMLALACFSF